MIRSARPWMRHGFGPGCGFQVATSRHRAFTDFPGNRAAMARKIARCSDSRIPKKWRTKRSGSNRRSNRKAGIHGTSLKPRRNRGRSSLRSSSEPIRKTPPAGWSLRAVAKAAKPPNEIPTKRSSQFDGICRIIASTKPSQSPGIGSGHSIQSDSPTGSGWYRASVESAPRPGKKTVRGGMRTESR